MIIPHDITCHKCGALTWRQEFGEADRHWDGGYVCAKCAVTPLWIGLVSPQGHTEYNARYVIGKHAEVLEDGKWYTDQELANIAGSANFLKDSSQAKEKNIKKWRCEKR